ncbi:MAG: hypothetical protein GXN93_01355 [Candidatus Diapherotrites archaeon]|nr:hypothetical protein [Candidatus Diapherotrites archaeon]
MPELARRVRRAKELVAPMAKKWATFVREGAAPKTREIGVKTWALLRDTGFPVAHRLYEKTTIAAAKATKKTEWKKDITELSIRTGTSQEKLEYIMNAMTQAGASLEDTKKSLRWMLERYGNENARFAYEHIHEELRKGIDPIVAHNAMIKTLEIIRRNPQHGERAEDIYRLARKIEALKRANQTRKRT